MVADRETAHSEQTMVIGLMIRSVDRIYIYISTMSTRVITLLYMCVYTVRGGKWLSMSRNKPTNEVAFLFCPKHIVYGAHNVYYSIMAECSRRIRTHANYLFGFRQIYL